MEKLYSRVRAAIDHYEMIREGDRIAVGVSGGKDSLFLLRALASLQRYYPQRFQLVAVTADPCFGGKENDFTGVEELCRELGLPYRIRRTDLGKIIFEDRQEKNPCSLCAKMRRGILHDMAREEGCNKVALGHHHDDAVETFFMNLLYGGKIASFSPVTYLSRKDLTVIRPLIFCDDREVRSAARRLALPVVASGCPVDGTTGRADTTALIRDLEQKFPDLKNKVSGAMQRAGISGW